jgi:hypothetical protein
MVGQILGAVLFAGKLSILRVHPNFGPAGFPWHRLHRALHLDLVAAEADCFLTPVKRTDPPGWSRELISKTGQYWRPLEPLGVDKGEDREVDWWLLDTLFSSLWVVHF